MRGLIVTSLLLLAACVDPGAAPGADAATDTPAGDAGAGPDGPAGDGGAEYAACAQGRWAPEWKITPVELRANDHFGLQLAASGDTFAVGLPRAEGGSVYVFRASTAGWDQEALLAPTTAPVPCFGSAVALSGDVLVVGSRGADCPGTPGGPWVFTRQASAWTEAGWLLPDDPEHEQSGWSVAADGDTIVVGAPLPGGPAPGQVVNAYVWIRAGDAWVRQATLARPENRIDFGQRVAVSGDLAAVRSSVDSSTYAEAIDVFRRTAGAWTYEVRLWSQPSGDVGIANDTIVAGNDQGYVSIFGSVDGAWRLWPVLRPGFEPVSRIGRNVAVAGDTIVTGTGAPRDWAQPANAYAYVFERCGTDVPWKLASLAVPTDANLGVGGAVARAGGRLFVGAPADGQRGELAGAAYVFRWLPEEGQTCGGGADCQSGHCVDGLCCDAACTEACTACSAAAKGWGADGYCEQVIAGGACPNNGYCRGAACLQKEELGTACQLDEQCRSGICSGSCCETRCDGPCEECVDGTCTLLPERWLPVGDRTCVPSLGAAPPGFLYCTQGLCDGVRGDACVLPPSGTPCPADGEAQPSCTEGIWRGGTCDGAGHCLPATRACAPYACGAGGTCLESCSGDGDCATGRTCDTGQHVCG